MQVIPEQVLLDLLARCIELSKELLPQMGSSGSQPVPESILGQYKELIDRLHQEKRHDSVLSDESWEWIWEAKEGLNHIQMYGRLAWLNYNLLDLL